MLVHRPALVHCSILTLDDMRIPKLKIKHKKSVIATLIVLVVIISGAIALNRLEQPDTALAVIGKPLNNQSGFNINLIPTPYKDSFVAFNYPEGLTKKHSNPPGAIDVDIVDFGAQDILSWTLSIDVTNTGSQPLVNDSSYRFRLEQPSIYKLSNLDINNQNIPVMTDTTASGLSKVAFLQHNNLRATVALLGDDANGPTPLQTTWNMILGSWRWQ
jgi:hypothetical protein